MRSRKNNSAVLYYVVGISAFERLFPLNKHNHFVTSTFLLQRTGTVCWELMALNFSRLRAAFGS